MRHRLRLPGRHLRGCGQRQGRTIHRGTGKRQRHDRGGDEDGRLQVVSPGFRRAHARTAWLTSSGRRDQMLRGERVGDLLLLGDHVRRHRRDAEAEPVDRARDHANRQAGVSAARYWATFSL